ncbi:6677_t:CDS:2 [Ambispora gerdemannii]|uniref:6677_t:CDS:1 n=1 Tax=Ambispora gerdemannii TaxID=144530 RepID=A0A9N9EWF0_9GLOM|nr:6677_t:CDS:2 [Ambispora gerdemannii]
MKAKKIPSKKLEDTTSKYELARNSASLEETKCDICQGEGQKSCVILYGFSQAAGPNNPVLIVIFYYWLQKYLMDFSGLGIAQMRKPTDESFEDSLAVPGCGSGNSKPVTQNRSVSSERPTGPISETGVANSIAPSSMTIVTETITNNSQSSDTSAKLALTVSLSLAGVIVIVGIFGGSYSPSSSDTSAKIALIVSLSLAGVIGIFGGYLAWKKFRKRKRTYINETIAQQEAIDQQETGATYTNETIAQQEAGATYTKETIAQQEAGAHEIISY